jgi:small-conductance mechanosensitive channel
MFLIKPKLTGQRVKAADAWAVRCDLTRKIKEAFDDSEIPFPQQVVHMRPPGGGGRVRR